VFEQRGISPESLLESLPEARERVFARRYSRQTVRKRGRKS
jgi:hypothetical protein